MRKILNETRNGLEVNLHKLVAAWLGKWWLILLCTCLGAVAAFCVATGMITPMYQAKVTVYVNNTASGMQLDTISNANLVTSQRLVNTYINMIASDTVLEKVAEASGIKVTPNQIRRAMSAKQVDDTELFNVVITHEDPELAALVANTIAEVAPGEIENFVKGSSAKIIDYAKVPSNPSSPNVRMFSILGGMLGGLMVLAYLTLRLLFDVRIKDEEDLDVMFDIPVLAQIPMFLAEGEHRAERYGKHAYETGVEQRGGIVR